MEIFPIKNYRFKLIDSKIETIERLKRRTEFSENLSSTFTDKSFRGIISNDEFKIISSTIGQGALWVISGKINNEEGEIKLEINKPFRILFSILLIASLLAFFVEIFKSPEDTLSLILVCIGQLLMIRFFFIGLIFTRFSNHSLNRFRDVLDIEYIK